METLLVRLIFGNNWQSAPIKANESWTFVVLLKLNTQTKQKTNRTNEENKTAANTSGLYQTQTHLSVTVHKHKPIDKITSTVQSKRVLTHSVTPYGI